MPVIDWEEKIKQKRLENISKVKEEILSKWLTNKINEFCKRTSICAEDIKDRINDNDKIVTAFLAKDPNKQNIHEKIAGDYIITIEGISEFKILPKSGKNAKILTNDGRVTFGNGVKSNKSIDFEFIYCGIHFYCSHKYTKDSGGAQDNSYNDLCNFLTSTRRVVDKKVYFLAIADGNYYANKLEIMNIEFVGSRCRAVSTENLKEFLESTFPKIK